MNYNLLVMLLLQKFQGMCQIVEIFSNLRFQHVKRKRLLMTGFIDDRLGCWDIEPCDQMYWFLNVVLVLNGFTSALQIIF